MVFKLVREKAEIWRAVDKANEKRRRRGESVTGGKSVPSAAAQTQQQQQRNNKFTCWTCGEIGHKSTTCNCASASGSGSATASASGSGSGDTPGSGGSAGTSGARPPSQQQRSSGAPQAKGTPLPLGGVLSNNPGRRRVYPWWDGQLCLLAEAVFPMWCRRILFSLSLTGLRRVPELRQLPWFPPGEPFLRMECPRPYQTEWKSSTSQCLGRVWWT